MWPKRNYENSFSPRGGGRPRGGFGRNQGWDRDGFQRRGWRQNGVGEKRPWSNKGDVSAQSKKRLKSSNHASFPLSTLMLVNPGDKKGSAPELLCSGFYDCVREAKIGRQSHFLRINISRKVYKGLKQKGVDHNKSDAVSIPVPLENIEAVTVLPGMKDFKNLLKAHSDRAFLRVSIARWVKVIEKRTVAHATKLEEFEKMPEIEEEPEAPEEEEVEAEPAQDVEENNSAMDVDAESAEVDPEEAQRKLAEKKEKLRLVAERKKLADAKKWAAKQKLEAERKERALKVKEWNLVKASVENLSAAVEKAKENLASDEEKLAQLEADFGEMLAFFQNEKDDDEAQELFLEELQEGMTPIPEEEEEQEEATEETEKASEDADVEGGEENADDTENEKVTEGDKAEEEGDTEMAEPTEPEKEESMEVTKSDICHKCGASGVAKKRFCGECGAKQVDPADANKITEVPVWLVIALKKPLEKFFVSDPSTTICPKELLEKSNMLVMEWNPKTDSAEQLKTLNNILAGPWKKLVRKAELVLKGSSPYSLEKTVQYLVKKHKRQEVWDNTLEKCKLCGKDVKRVVMQRHLTKMCHMREEPCQYCGEVLVVSKMEEHYETCPKYPVKCPLRCGANQLERCMVEEHKQTVCKNFEVNCEFKAMGCDMVLKRREITRHMRDLEIEHMKLVRTRMEIVSNYLVGKDSSLETVFNPPAPAKEEEEPMEEEVGTETADQTSSKMEEE